MTVRSNPRPLRLELVLRAVVRRQPTDEASHPRQSCLDVRPARRSERRAPRRIVTVPVPSTLHAAGVRPYARPDAPAAAGDHPMERRLDPARLGDHFDRLYRVAWALCGSREDAENLVQETYARLLARPRLLRNEDRGRPGAGRPRSIALVRARGGS